MHVVLARKLGLPPHLPVAGLVAAVSLCTDGIQLVDEDDGTIAALQGRNRAAQSNRYTAERGMREGPHRCFLSSSI